MPERCPSGNQDGGFRQPRSAIVEFYFDSDDLRRNSDRPGARPLALDQRQRVEFLRLLRGGMGRATACLHFGIDVDELNRVLARSAAFREAVEHVEQVRAENLFSGLYVAALNGDAQAARFLLGRERARGANDGSC
jgi:hypothetical protein